MRFADLVPSGESRWIISRYYDWLEIRDNKGEGEKEAEILNYILTKNEHRVREGTWSASSAGMCLRQQQFTFHGVKKQSPGVKGLNIFANGDYMHLRHQVAGLRMGYLKGVEIPVRNERLKLRGTIDAVTTEDVVVDFKSINSRGFGGLLGPKPSHKLQVHAYMFTQGLGEGMVVYENKDTQELKEFRFDRDESLVDQLREDYVQLNRLEEQKKLAPPLSDRNCFECRYCPFNRTCRGLASEDVFK